MYTLSCIFVFMYVCILYGYTIAPLYFLVNNFFINLLFYLMGKYAKKIGIFLFETKSKN